MKEILITCLLLVACTTSKFMTYEQYYQIPIGEEVSIIQVELGRPFEVKEVGPSTQEYIYVERIPLGETREMFRRYILTVLDGKIIQKRVEEEVTSPLQLHG